MLFNSFEFALFLPIVFIIYWFFTKNRLNVQNVLIVIASYVFYGWWDWRFLSLIFLSTIVDFILGIRIQSTANHKYRKYILWTSIAVNLGILGFFKYFNFFQENLISALEQIGIHMHASSLNIILPVGISFYTFQTLSYTIDVYRQKLTPTRDFIAFAAFVSFFPQLVAGPIERATHLLPQFFKNRVFNYHQAIDGMRQILWGLFKKVVIADNCAQFVNEIFQNSPELNGSSLLLGGIFFTFQIYGDFSGYSDIAIGVSRLFGFDLKRNFAFPFFSRDIAEFWRRWHISLSTWFRDYLYIPLGGSRGNKLVQIRNIFVIFLVSGFWHGANWTYIVWGLLNAIYILPLIIFNRNRTNLDIVAKGNLFPSILDTIKIVVTFLLTMLAFVVFRTDNLSEAALFYSNLFSNSLFDKPDFDGLSTSYTTIGLIVVFMIIEWFGREREYAIQNMFVQSKSVLRYSFYYFLIFLVLWYLGSEEEFIYFQF